MRPKISQLTRRFQVWSENSNLITFDPLFGQKAVKNWLSLVFYQFSTVVWPKRVSNVILFEFWGKIWNLFVIWDILDPICCDLQILICWPPMHFQNFKVIWANRKRSFSGKRILPCWSAWPNGIRIAPRTDEKWKNLKYEPPYWGSSAARPEMEGVRGSEQQCR